MTTIAPYQHSATTRRGIEGLARVACPPQLETFGLVDAVVDHVALSMASMPTLFRRGLIAGVQAYELGARAYPENRGKPASKLEHSRALRYFLRWKDSPLMPQREFAKAIKGLLCLGYYEQQQVKEQIDYLPERWIQKVTRTRLAVYAEPIAKHAASLLEPDPLPLARLFPEPAEPARPAEEVS